MTWICLVDDDVDVCESLMEGLQSTGYEVQAFVDGSDALEGIERIRTPPSLVLLDLLLPHMTGRQVLEHLRRGQRAPNVPVIVITGMDTNEAAFGSLGVSAVLRKPIAMVELLAVVRRVLGASA